MLSGYRGRCVFVDNSEIEAISSDILKQLECGDAVIKCTGKQKHLYLVSYKGEGAGEGICLTYTACGYIETLSYDFNATTKKYEFNSKDVWQAQ